jgi:hypothetical protein
MLGITSNVAFSWLMFSRQLDYKSLITGDVITSCGCSGTYFERSSKGLDHGINLFRTFICNLETPEAGSSR